MAESTAGGALQPAKEAQGVVPPQNIEAEASVLGSILLEGRELFEIVADKLQTADFYRVTNGKIFSAMIDLFKTGDAIDALTISNRLEEKKDLEDVGGASYLTELAGRVPSTSNFESYVDIVQEKATLRRLISVSSEISRSAFAEADQVTTIVDVAEKRLFEVADTFHREAFINLSEVLSESFERIEKMHENKGELRGIPTGYRSLDAKLSGLQGSDLVVLAARPSMGKTALALNIARNAAVQARVSVGIFSLEMSKEQLVDRLLVMEAGVDAWKLRTGHLAEPDFPKLASAMDALSKSKIHIDDTPGLSVMEMRARARRLQASAQLDLLIVDYLQLMEGSSSRGPDNRVQEISEISRFLKALARELKIPVLAISQLSRAVEQRPDRVPELSDLRESGAIEQDADVVMFIYRDEYYHPSDSDKPTDKPNVAEIFIKKHRNGPTGKAELYFSADKQKFTDLKRESSSSDEDEDDKSPPGLGR
jgi:replicative DNA helicase